MELRRAVDAGATVALVPLDSVRGRRVKHTYCELCSRLRLKTENMETDDKRQPCQLGEFECHKPNGVWMPLHEAVLISLEA